VTQQAIAAVSCREFAASRLHIKASGYSLLQHTARLVLREVSTVASEMRVPKLPASPGTSRLVVWLFSLFYGIGFLIVFYIQANDRRRINLQRQRAQSNEYTATRIKEPL